MNRITVNGAGHVPATDKPSDVQIVVVDGRWNFIARVSREPGFVVLTDASVIVYWGTTKGLGELAKGGPTGKTRLNPCNGTVRIPEARVVFTLDTNAGKWSL